MSNPAKIDVLTVEKLSGSKWKEIRIADDYGFGNIILDDEIDFNVEDDLEVLLYCFDNGCDWDERIPAILDFVSEMGNGIQINDEYYEWDIVKKVFER